MTISGIKIRIGEDEKLVFAKAKKESGLQGKFFRILKKSLDARDKGDIFYTYSVEISDEPFAECREEIKEYNHPQSVVIVGFGPSGLFCALALSRAGFKPTVIERGGDVDERKNKTQRFFTNADLDSECNIQYGEGGAGTFSDGKLNTTVKSDFKQYVLHELVRHGAPQEIAYLAKPHIGSDKLPSVVKSIREEIIANGGQVLFNTTLVDVIQSGGKIKKLVLKNSKGGLEQTEADEVVLAIGHSSRDTYRKLFERGIVMEQKDCAIGVRVEHLQEDINRAQFGKDIGVVADYKATSNKGERGVFSFCMCPGGVVVPSSSEEGGVVTNGMSEFARDKINANSAIVCQIRKSDYGDGVLSGMDFLQKIERRAFTLAGGNYRAPVQNMIDFIAKRQSKSFGKVTPSYAIGTEFCKMDDVLPAFVCDNLRIGLTDINKRIKGFSESGILTAPETRTSSPVRIIRTESLTAVGVENLYPAGEVGYAGGIMSAAIDGLKIAEKIKCKYEK